jgi:hypothetical protein
VTTADWISAFVTIALTGAGYFISGPKVADSCIAVGIIGSVLLHFTKKGEKPESKGTVEIKDSFTQSQTFSPTFSPTFAPQIRIENYPASTPPEPQRAVLTMTDRDPCVIPRYEKSANAIAGINNSDWFVLSNEGSIEAYDVAIAEFQVGDTILRFGKTALIHSEKYATASPELFDIHRGKVPNYGIAIAFNGGWSAWCRETKPKPPLGAKFEQGTRVTYRDRANNWFCTEFTMIYDVRKDFIEVDNIKHSRLPSSVNVELVPSSGPRPDVLLTVKNRGGTRNFYAQCTPLALRNSPNALRAGTFDLKWEHTFDRCVTIGAGASSNLLIATFDVDHKNALAKMEIWGLSGNTKKQCEWSRWNLESGEKVPEYDLEISIFSDGVEGPFSEHFTLSAESWYGSPKLTRISKQEGPPKT